MYRELIANIKPQVDAILTIAHGPEAKKYAQSPLRSYTESLPDLSVMWNIGLDWAEKFAKGRPYYVAGLNDDALVADDWYQQMVTAIETNNTTGASTPRAPGKARSIFGGAWVIKGGEGIRMSGVAKWWYTDDEIQKLCQAVNGFTIVPNVYAVNRLANESTRASKELQAINSKDWPAFKARYGNPEAPWAATDFHIIISAPSGETPHHIINTIPTGRDYTVMTEGWELDQLIAAAKKHPRFVFLKESAHIKPGFWEAIESERGSAWFFPRPSCYMGIYDAKTVNLAAQRLRKVTDKQGSINNEWRIHDIARWNTIWDDVTDANPLRLETVNGVDEFVIGNNFIEKYKSTARCGQCAQTTAPGICDHLRQLAVERSQCQPLFT